MLLPWSFAQKYEVNLFNQIKIAVFYATQTRYSLLKCSTDAYSSRFKISPSIFLNRWNGRYVRQFAIDINST